MERAAIAAAMVHLSDEDQVLLTLANLPPAMIGAQAFYFVADVEDLLRHIEAEYPDGVTDDQRKRFAAFVRQVYATGYALRADFRALDALDDDDDEDDNDD
jgi:hypothetical protein